LIYNELAGAELGMEEPSHTTARQVAYMIDQSHNIEGKVAPMIWSVLNCQEAYAKALIVPRKQLAQAQTAGEVLTAHAILTNAYRTDVRPLLEQVRTEMGVPVDPLATFKSSGYEKKVSAERGIAATSGGFQ